MIATGRAELVALIPKVLVLGRNATVADQLPALERDGRGVGFRGMSHPMLQESSPLTPSTCSPHRVGTPIQTANCPSVLLRRHMTP
jgi:hypothetical protein